MKAANYFSLMVASTLVVVSSAARMANNIPVINNINTVVITQLEGSHSMHSTIKNSNGLCAAGDNPQQCDVLVALAKSTNYESWANNNGWLKGGSYCKWHGVTCYDGTTDVKYLNLQNNNLSGSLPEELGSLSELTDLYFYNNEIKGSIPSSLGKLTKCNFLELYNNTLTGSIPSTLGDLTKMMVLTLDSNQLTGPIPDTLGQLTVAGTLSLTHNQLTGTIPESLGKMTQLTNLMLNNNQLSGRIPETLGQLPIVGSIYLGNNKLSGAIPDALGQIDSLMTLTLENNQLSGAIPDGFCSASNPFFTKDGGTWGYCLMSGNKFACPLPWCALPPSPCATQCQ